MKIVSFKIKSGFSLVELIIALAASMIILLAIGIVLSDGMGAFDEINNNTFSDAYDDAIYARRFFDATIRKSSGVPLFNPVNKSVKVYFYNSWGSTFLDCYTRFYLNGDTLQAENGTVNSGGTENYVSTDIICENVSNCDFNVSGKSAQMILELNDGTNSYTVATSAVAQN